MSIDRNIVIKLHKSGVSNSEIAKRLKMNRTTVWKIIKKFQEIGTTLDREGRGRKRTVRTPQLIKNTREKLRRNSRRSCRNLAAAAGVLQKMQETFAGYRRRHAAQFGLH